MNKGRHLFLLLVFASAPVGVGLLITAAAMLQSFADLGNRGVGNPNELSDKIAVGLSYTHLGLVISGPLWVGWALYAFLSTRSKPDDSNQTKKP